MHETMIRHMDRNGKKGWKKSHSDGKSDTDEVSIRKRTATTRDIYKLIRENEKKEKD